MSKCKIIGQRFLRKYTAPKKTPVYSAQIDVQTIAKTLCDVKWEKVSVKDAAMAYHDDKLLDDNVVERDAFDAALFCSDHKDGLHLAHANAAVYVYAMPDSAIGKTLSSLKINVTSDPYNVNGARLHVMTSSALAIPTNCKICRGEDESGNIIANGSTLSRVAVRTVRNIGGTDYWYPTNETATIAPASLTLQKYLFVFVLMENYATVRGNWIEGCSYISNSVEIETVENVDGWTDGETYDLTNGEAREYNVCRDGVLPLQVQSGVKSITLMADGSDLLKKATKTMYQLYKTDGVKRSVLSSFDGPITGIFGDSPIGVETRQTVTSNGQTTSNTYQGAIQYVAITGKFSQRTFSDLPGLVLYDVRADKILSAGAAGNVNATIKAKIAAGEISGVYFTLPSLSVTADAIKANVRLFVCFRGGFVSDDQTAITYFIAFSADTQTGEIDNVAPLSGASFVTSKDIPYCAQGAFNNVGKWATLNCDISVSGGKLKVINGLGEILSGVDYSGEITGVDDMSREMLGGALGGFIVSGNLTKIDGVACKNCAIVRFDNSGNVSVTVPWFDESITPDTYKDFKVSLMASSFSTPSLGVVNVLERDLMTYTISGAFTALGGDTSYKYLAYASDVGSTIIAGAIDEFMTGVTGSASISTVSGHMTIYGGAAGGVGAVKRDDINVSISDEAKSIGLRTAYARLYNGEIPLVVSSAKAMKRVGAGFVVRPGTALVDVLGSGGAMESVTVPTWQMTLSSLVVPFALPQEFTANKIRLNWPKIAATGGHLNVWIKREYIAAVPEIADPSIYLGDRQSVSGWELLGVFGVDQTTATVKSQLSGYCATLLFTAFCSLDSLNPSETMIMPQGVATALNVNSITGACAGLNTTWKPDITLIG